MANADAFNQGFDAGMGSKKNRVKSGNNPKKAGGVEGEFKKGGKVHKTGKYKLHRNEVVLTASQAKTYKKKHKKTARKKAVRKA